MNCEKNAVVCEGYNEKTIWKSGREKADEGKVPSSEFNIVTDKGICSTSIESTTPCDHPSAHLSRG